MPFPALFFVAIGIGLTGYGIKKGLDAVEDFNKAKDIGAAAENKYKKYSSILNDSKKQTQETLETLGRLKIDIFTTQVKYALEIMKDGGECQNENSDPEYTALLDNLPEIEKMVGLALEIKDTMHTVEAAAAFTTVGSYSINSILTTAQPGATISSLQEP